MQLHFAGVNRRGQAKTVAVRWLRALGNLARRDDGGQLAAAS